MYSAWFDDAITGCRMRAIQVYYVVKKEKKKNTMLQKLLLRSTFPVRITPLIRTPRRYIYLFIFRNARTERVN